MNPAVLELLKVKRFYVFFKDGTWRTAIGNQWKEEQIWKLEPEKTGWVGGEFDAQVLQAAISRFG